MLEREGAFSWLMLTPGVLFLLAFVAYPFFYGIYLSLQDRPVAQAGVFVGLANFVTLLHDGVFWQVTRNTFVYTIVTTVLKLLGGLAMALVMNQSFRGRNLARAFLLLPFIVPTVLSTIAWMWIFDPDLQRDQLDARAHRRHRARGSRGSATPPWPWCRSSS